MKRIIYPLVAFMIAAGAAVVAYQLNTGSSGPSTGAYQQQSPGGDSRYKDFKLNR